MKKNRLIAFAAALCIGLTSLITISNSVIAAEDNTEYTITDEIHGINDSVFYIARPDEASLTVVNASQFGLSADAEDNTQAMRNAFEYCRHHPNTKLVIDKGIYHFSPEEDIYLNTLKNTLIDANNSEFIFSTPHYFKVYACDNVEIRNMIVDWDWDTLRLGSLVKVENENDAENTLEIEFTELDEVNADIPLLSFMQYAEQVEILDLFHPWLTFCLENTYTVAKEYYAADGLHLNLSGADKMAQMIDEQLFPPEESGEIVEDPYKDFDTASTIYYQTEVLGEPVSNPHKGFVMTLYNPDMFESTFPYGIGGSMENHAWDVVTICNGVHYWEDINPQEGVYNWKEIDDMLDACEKYGMTYVIRILPYSHLSGSHENYGEAHDFVPQWVYDKGAKKKRVTLLEDPSVALDVPVWDDEIYLQACKDFATALGEHFDGDPRVEFVDIRPFGNWGEWHFSQVTGSEMPSVEIQKDMLKHYVECILRVMKFWLHV